MTAILDVLNNFSGKRVTAKFDRKKIKCHKTCEGCSFIKINVDWLLYSVLGIEIKIDDLMHRLTSLNAFHIMSEANMVSFIRYRCHSYSYVILIVFFRLYQLTVRNRPALVFQLPEIKFAPYKLQQQLAL